MNVVLKLVLAILLNILVIGCTPVNVALNSEFGLSLGKSDDEQNTITAKIVVETRPEYINKANSTNLAFSGTCENLISAQVKINGAASDYGSITCTSGQWRTNIDVSPIPDGNVIFEFLDSSSRKSLKTLSIAKDTDAPTALLGYAMTQVNNSSTIMISVDPAIGVIYYSYKYGLTSSTDCSVASGYSTYASTNSFATQNLTSGDGNYKLCLIGKDSFENEQSYANATSITWQLDTAPPVLSFDSATSSTYVNSLNKNAFSFTVNCSEIGRNVKLKTIDKNAVELFAVVACSSSNLATYTFNVSPFAEGLVKFFAIQEDEAGNTTNYLALSLTKDSLPPAFANSTVVDANYYASLTQSPIITWSTTTDVGGSGFHEFQIGFGSNNASPNLVSFQSVGTITSRQYTFIGGNLTEDSLYYTFVKAIDMAGNSAVIVSDGWKPDVTAPTVGTVDDGTYASPGSTQTVSWGAGNDSSGSGIDHYELAIGTTSGGTEILTWSNVGTVTSITESNSALNFGGGTYYVSIRAVDIAGNIGSASLGDGFRIKPTISLLASNSGAYAAIMTNGKVVAWGDSSYGGDYSSIPTALKTGSLTATHIAATTDAFAAIASDGSVYSWGNSSSGGDMSSVANDLNGSIDAVQIISNSFAFAVRRSDGSVVSWGNSNYGGTVSASMRTALDGTIPVVDIKASNSAFAALRSDGSVIAWGLSSGGGDTTSVASDIDGTNDVSEIYTTSAAFIAKRVDGSLVSWGYYPSGVSFSDIASSVNGSVPVTHIQTTPNAAAAIRSDGSVITWGSSSHGGNSSAVASAIDGTIDVSSIYSNGYSFSALRIDGSVITWGQSDKGGDSSAVAALLTGSPYKTVSIAHNYTAYAAIQDNGSIIAWGLASSGGSPAFSAGVLDGSIKATYVAGSYAAFAALRENGSVITWGSSGYGGDSSSVATKIDGTKPVVALYANMWSFVAVYSDGQFVTWGDVSVGGDSSAINPD